jgi:hypothetical protein
MRFRGVAIALALAALPAAALAAPASAGNEVRFDSKVRISLHAPAFHGRVESENHACEVNRTVKLFKRRDGADKLIGTDDTNGQGRWLVSVDPLKVGRYYARVKRREEGAAGTTFVCRADQSRDIRVIETPA